MTKSLINLNEYPSINIGVEYLRFVRNLILNSQKVYDKNIPSPFFIIGAGRSGNTLLRSILVANKKVSIPPESYVLSKTYHHYKAYRFLNWPLLVQIIISDFESHRDFKYWNINLTPVYQKCISLHKNERSLNRIIFEVYKCYSKTHAPDANIYGDKTPLNTLYINIIDKIFPNAKYINLIRDGRDVVNSYLKSSLNSDIYAICKRWNKSIEKVNRFKNKKRNQVLEVHYESLVNNTETEIKKICDFLDIKFNNSMLKRENVLTKLGDVNNLSHHQNVLNNINVKSIGKWKKELSIKEQQIIESLLKKNLTKLGYL